jgi:hypothetical protein
MTQEHIFVLKVNTETKNVSLYQPSTVIEGKGRAIALDYKQSKLKRALAHLLKLIVEEVKE